MIKYILTLDHDALNTILSSLYIERENFRIKLKYSSTTTKEREEIETTIKTLNETILQVHNFKTVNQ